MRWPGEPKFTPRYGGLQVREDDCSYVWNIPAAQRCSWVRKTPDCEVGSFVPYPTLLFCTFGTESSAMFGAGLALLILYLLYLFLILGTTSDNFFCPSLSIIASVLRLSENIAGVTILAFGNGSPDIFTSLVASEDERLIMFTELIGAGVFVTAIIAGSVAVFSPFRVQPKYFLRDACFYVFSACWISYIVQDYVMHLWEAMSCIAIYIIFIVTVVLMQRIETNSDRRKKRMPRLQDEVALRAFVANRRGDSLLVPQLPKRSRAFDVQAKLEPLPRRKVIEISLLSDLFDLFTSPKFSTPDVAINREVERERNLNGRGADGEIPASPQSSRPQGLFREFFYDVNPINADEWRSARVGVKLILVLRAPFMLVLQLLVPVVNETAEKRGWSKLLNCVQMCLTPLAALCVLELWDAQIGPVPLLAICFGCTSLLALVIFLLTSADRIPKFHNALAFVGFLTAMLVVYAVAQEVMAVLETVGFASGISDAMLGITLLSWGNSVGDLISNVTIARKGYPRMGFSACFGGPMFNTLLGLGLTFGISAARADGFKIAIRTSDMAPGCLAFLLCSLVSSLIYLTITGFAARRTYGYLLYSVYGVFMLINVLSELHVIHPLGTDHRPDNVI